MLSKVKAKRRQTVIDKTKPIKENQFFYKETFFGDESSDENSSNSDEDTESLFLRARNLVNDEFRLMTLNPGDQQTDPIENYNMTPKQFYKELSVKKKIESEKNTRKQILQEWDALKNASMLSDDSTSATEMESRPRDAQKVALRGVVAYIEVGPNKKLMNSLTSILKSMGATVLDVFAQEVTHVVFKKGSNETFKRAKLLNASLVSVLWVEACKNAGNKVSEKLFPVMIENKYCNSPRVFRKYLEFRKEHFQFINGDLVPISHNQSQSNKQDMQAINYKNIDKANFGATTSYDISGITKFKDPSTKKVAPATAAEDNNSSDDEIRLHLSADDSRSIESNEQSNSIDAENEIVHEKTSPTKTMPLVNENAESLPAIPKNVSPSKRKLFQKFPLNDSFVSYDRASTDSLKLAVQNPYQTSNEKSIKSRKMDETDESLATNKSDNSKTKQPPVIKQLPTRKKKSPVKRDSIFKPLRISGRSPRKNYVPQKSWPKLVSTSLHSVENRSLERCISRLGNFRLGHKVDKFTTHVVAGGSHRTVNLLKAVARGCWVVNRDWVLQSEIAGHWVTEDVYELAEFSQVVRRSRTQKQALGKDFSLEIFDECGNIFISQDSRPPWKDLQELVVLCGGKVTSILDTANIVVGAVEGATQKCVSVKWILDSITYGRSKSFSNYYL